jgi:hypothetical protein
MKRLGGDQQRGLVATTAATAGPAHARHAGDPRSTGEAAKGRARKVAGPLTPCRFHSDSGIMKSRTQAKPLYHTTGPGRTLPNPPRNPRRRTVLPDHTICTHTLSRVSNLYILYSTLVLRYELWNCGS